MEELLLDVIRKNYRHWRNWVMGKRTRRGISESKWWEKEKMGMVDGTEGYWKRVCCRRQNDLKPLCVAFSVAARSTRPSSPGSEDDEMFWKCSSTPAELIHSLWFTTAIRRRLNASLFPLRGYALPTWCNHTNQHFFLYSTPFHYRWNTFT